MLSAIIKDKKIRNLVNKVENKNTLNKFLFFYILSFYNKVSKKSHILFYLNMVSKNSSINNKNRITNRCVLTNRGRSVFRQFNISRIILRELLQFGILPGFSKAVW